MVHFGEFTLSPFQHREVITRAASSAGNSRYICLMMANDGNISLLRDFYLATLSCQRRRLLIRDGQDKQQYLWFRCSL